MSSVKVPARIPSEEQIKALETAKVRLGPEWKSSLITCWLGGNYRAANLSDVSHLLQQVRNQFGPSWLHSQDCTI